MEGKAGRTGLIRQGDVLLIPVDADDVDGAGTAPVERLPVARHDGRLVLAEGEATGHAHVVSGGGARLELQRWGERRPVWINHVSWSDERTVLVVPEGPARLVHEEHDELVVPAGTYEVRRQREYEPAGSSRGWRRVED